MHNRRKRKPKAKVLEMERLIVENLLAAPGERLSRMALRRKLMGQLGRENVSHGSYGGLLDRMIADGVLFKENFTAPHNPTSGWVMLWPNQQHPQIIETLERLRSEAQAAARDALAQDRLMPVADLTLAPDVYADDFCEHCGHFGPHHKPSECIAAQQQHIRALETEIAAREQANAELKAEQEKERELHRNVEQAQRHRVAAAEARAAQYKAMLVKIARGDWLTKHGANGDVNLWNTPYDQMTNQEAALQLLEEIRQLVDESTN